MKGKSPNRHHIYLLKHQKRGTRKRNSPSSSDQFYWCKLNSLSKFRNRFYQETHIQYGDSVDEKIIQVADTLSNVGNILDNLIYKPIYKSYNNIDKTINVSRAIEAQLDINGWLNIIEHVCHNFLQITKPSIHSIKQFVERLNKNNFTKEMKFQLKNNLQIIIYKKNCDNYFIKFFI